MSETQPATQEAVAKETGYAAIGDMGDCVRELIPRGTAIALMVDGFELNAEERGKEHIIGKVTVVGPEDFEDYGGFAQRFYLGNVPKPGKGAKQTAFHMSRRTWCEMVAAVLQVPYTHEDVRFFFRGAVTADPDADAITFFEEIVAQLNTLQGQTFTTKIGIEIDRKGQYDPKQTIGKPDYPSDDEYAMSHASNGNGHAG